MSTIPTRSFLMAVRGSSRLPEISSCSSRAVRKRTPDRRETPPAPPVGVPGGGRGLASRTHAESPRGEDPVWSGPAHRRNHGERGLLRAVSCRATGGGRFSERLRRAVPEVGGERRGDRAREARGGALARFRAAL